MGIKHSDDDDQMNSFDLHGQDRHVIVCVLLPCPGYCPVAGLGVFIVKM